MKKPFKKQGGLPAKKSLGQNFLWHLGTLQKIVEAADLQPDDHVIEVGPGKGILTEEILKKTPHLTVIELDDRLILGLKAMAAVHPTMKVIHGDALHFTPPNTPYKVVANIPYYITSPLLNQFLKDQPPERRAQSLTLMVQKEVGHKICAKDGDLNVLAAHVQLFGTPRLVAVVPAEHFHPKPKVDSAVIHITSHTPPIEESLIDPFFRFLHKGFEHPRKKLLNNLKGTGITLETLQSTFVALGLSENLRAEHLLLDQWITLFTRMKR